MSSLGSLSSQDSSSRLFKIAFAYFVGVVHLIDVLEALDRLIFNSWTQAWKGLIEQEHSNGFESKDNIDKRLSTSLRGSIRMMSLCPNFNVSRLNNPLVKSPLTTCNMED